jgi:hypothetical protein
MRPPHLYAAVYVMLQQGSRVLMSRRANTGFKDGLFHPEIFAGNEFCLWDH